MRLTRESVGLLAAIVTVELGAMTVLTQNGRSGHWGWLTLGIVGYTFVGILFALLMQSTGGSLLAFVNTTWNSLTILTAALISVLLFKDTFLWYQWLGIGFAVVAVVLLGVGEMNRQ